MAASGDPLNDKTAEHAPYKPLEFFVADIPKDERNIRVLKTAPEGGNTFSTKAAIPGDVPTLVYFGGDGFGADAEGHQHAMQTVVRGLREAKSTDPIRIVSASYPNPGTPECKENIRTVMRDGDMKYSQFGKQAAYELLQDVPDLEGLTTTERKAAVGALAGRLKNTTFVGYSYGARVVEDLTSFLPQELTKRGFTPEESKAALSEFKAVTYGDSVVYDRNKVGPRYGKIVHIANIHDETVQEAVKAKGSDTPLKRGIVQLGDNEWIIQTDVPPASRAVFAFDPKNAEHVAAAADGSTELKVLPEGTPISLTNDTHRAYVSKLLSAHLADVLNPAGFATLPRDEFHAILRSKAIKVNEISLGDHYHKKLVDHLRDSGSLPQNLSEGLKRYESGSITREELTKLEGDIQKFIENDLNRPGTQKNSIFGHLLSPEAMAKESLALSEERRELELKLAELEKEKLTLVENPDPKRAKAVESDIKITSGKLAGNRTKTEDLARQVELAGKETRGPSDITLELEATKQSLEKATESLKKAKEQLELKQKQREEAKQKRSANLITEDELKAVTLETMTLKRQVSDLTASTQQLEEKSTTLQKQNLNSSLEEAGARKVVELMAEADLIRLDLKLNDPAARPLFDVLQERGVLQRALAKGAVMPGKIAGPATRASGHDIPSYFGDNRAPMAIAYPTDAKAAQNALRMVTTGGDPLSVVAQMPVSVALAGPEEPVPLTLEHNTPQPQPPVRRVVAQPIKADDQIIFVREDLPLKGARATVGTDSLHFDPVKEILIPKSQVVNRTDTIPLSDVKKFTPKQLKTIDKLADDLGIMDPHAVVSPQEAQTIVQETLALLPADHPVIKMALQNPHLEIVVVAGDNVNAYSRNHKKGFSTEAFSGYRDSKPLIYIAADEPPKARAEHLAHELKHRGIGDTYGRIDQVPFEPPTRISEGSNTLIKPSLRNKIYFDVIADAMSSIEDEARIKGDKRTALEIFEKELGMSGYNKHKTKEYYAEVIVRVQDLVEQNKWNDTHKKHFSGLRKYYDEVVTKDAAAREANPGAPLPELTAEQIRLMRPSVSNMPDNVLLLRPIFPEAVKTDVHFGKIKIQEILQEVILSNKDLQKAVQAGGIRFEPQIGVNADALVKAGLKPAEVTQTLAGVLQKATGGTVTATYEKRLMLGWGKPDMNSSATLSYTGNTADVSHTFSQSTNPVIRKHVNEERKILAKEAADEKARVEKEAAIALEKQLREASAKAKAARDKGSPFHEGSLKPSALVTVHATRYMPKRNSDGSVEISTLHMTNGNDYPRNTLHFALNHKVASHDGGSWAESPITILGPFDKMSLPPEKGGNGPPANLLTQDTFWTSGFNKPIIVPDATLVIPGEVKKGVFELSLTETRYKTANFTEADVKQISEALSAYDLKAMNDLLAKAGDAPTREKILARFSNQVAVEATMDHLGYTVHEAGKDGWDKMHPVYDERRLAHKLNYEQDAGRMGYWESVRTGVPTLAKTLGATSGLHTNTPYGTLEDTVKEILHSTYFMEEVIKDPSALKKEGKNYSIPSEKDGKPTPRRLSGADYLEIMEGPKLETTYFQDRFKRLDKGLADVDQKTRDVYRDWRVKMEARIERINAYVEGRPVPPPVVNPPAPQIVAPLQEKPVAEIPKRTTTPPVEDVLSQRPATPEPDATVQVTPKTKAKPVDVAAGKVMAVGSRGVGWVGLAPGTLNFEHASTEEKVVTGGFIAIEAGQVAKAPGVGHFAGPLVVYTSAHGIIEGGKLESNGARTMVYTQNGVMLVQGTAQTVATGAEIVGAEGVAAGAGVVGEAVSLPLLVFMAADFGAGYIQWKIDGNHSNDMWDFKPSTGIMIETMEQSAQEAKAFYTPHPAPRAYIPNGKRGAHDADNVLPPSKNEYIFLSEASHLMGYLPDNTNDIRSTLNLAIKQATDKGDETAPHRIEVYKAALKELDHQRKNSDGLQWNGFAERRHNHTAMLNAYERNITAFSLPDSGYRYPSRDEFAKDIQEYADATRQSMNPNPAATEESAKRLNALISRRYSEQINRMLDYAQKDGAVDFTRIIDDNKRIASDSGLDDRTASMLFITSEDQLRQLIEVHKFVGPEGRLVGMKDFGRPSAEQQILSLLPAERDNRETVRQKADALSKLLMIAERKEALNKARNLDEIDIAAQKNIYEEAALRLAKSNDPLTTMRVKTALKKLHALPQINDSGEYEKDKALVGQVGSYLDNGQYHYEKDVEQKLVYERDYTSPNQQKPQKVFPSMRVDSYTYQPDVYLRTVVQGPYPTGGELPRLYDEKRLAPPVQIDGFQDEMKRLGAMLEAQTVNNDPKLTYRVSRGDYNPQTNDFMITLQQPELTEKGKEILVHGWFDKKLGAFVYNQVEFRTIAAEGKEPTPGQYVKPDSLHFLIPSERASVDVLRDVMQQESDKVFRPGQSRDYVVETQLITPARTYRAKELPLSGKLVGKTIDKMEEGYVVYKNGSMTALSESTLAQANEALSKVAPGWKMNGDHTRFTLEKSQQQAHFALQFNEKNGEASSYSNNEFIIHATRLPDGKFSATAIELRDQGDLGRGYSIPLAKPVVFALGDKAAMQEVVEVVKKKAPSLAILAKAAPPQINTTPAKDDPSSAFPGVMEMTELRVRTPASPLPQTLILHRATHDAGPFKKGVLSFIEAQAKDGTRAYYPVPENKELPELVNMVLEAQRQNIPPKIFSKLFAASTTDSVKIMELRGPNAPVTREQDRIVSVANGADAKLQQAFTLYQANPPSAGSTIPLKPRTTTPSAGNTLE